MAQPPSGSKPPGGEPSHTSRRGALRVTGLEIATTFTLGDEKTPQRGVMIDLSATGALLVTEQPLPEGQVLHVEFSAPKGPRIKGTATVVRCLKTPEGRHAAGVAFGISVDEELDLAQWVFDRV